MKKSNQVEINGELVEFNLENIMAGKFGSTKGKSTGGKFKMYASLRLLKESGWEATDVQSQLLTNMAYKWYYYKLNNNESTGTIIIGLHKKDINLWTYVTITPTGETANFDTITDAKASL